MRKLTTTLAVVAGVLGLVTEAAWAQAAKAPVFVLSGVVVSGDRPATAWLQEPTLTRNRPVAVKEGETVGPYRVTSIREDRVELEGPGEKILVPLYASATSAAGPALAPIGAGRRPPEIPGAAPPVAGAQTESESEGTAPPAGVKAKPDLKALFESHAGSVEPQETEAAETGTSEPRHPPRAGAEAIRKLFEGLSQSPPGAAKKPAR